MLYLKYIYFALAVLAFASLSACGGGDANSASENNNWDQMTWDKGNWE